MENSGKKMQNKIGSSIKYGLLGEVRIFYRKYDVTLKYKSCDFYRVRSNITKKLELQKLFHKKRGGKFVTFSQR